MRFSTRSLTIVVLVAGCPFDPETPEFEVITDSETESSSGSSSTVGMTVDPSDPDTTDNPTTPSTTNPATTDDPTDTDTGAVCGDGEIDGDEVCDDGVNDGSYDGCMPDCDALGPSCGDTEINGDEVCDDGINDGGYGGCAVACDALGPYCGDGTMDGPELCDNGAKNANGSGCNIDCVTSGTVIGTFMAGDLDFCDGTFVTKPVFRDDGNALIAVTGYCDQDSVVLAEFSPAVEIAQEFDDLLLPQTPVREATLAADNWVLATYGCNYSITPEGVLTEVCVKGRNSGDAALDARDDGSYIALNYDGIASYPVGSPMNGDFPDWQLAPPDDGFYDFSYYYAALGESDATIVVGSRRIISNNTYSGYLARFTAAGNSAGTYSFPEYESLGTVATGSDGTVVVVTGYPAYRVMRLNDSFDEAWGFSAPTYGDVLVDVDSTGAVVMGYTDNVSNLGVLRKWTNDGLTELWSIEVPVGYNSRMAIADDDSIWIATATFNGYGVARVSP